MSVLDNDYKDDKNRHEQYKVYDSNPGHLCLMIMYVGATFANHFKHQ